MYTRIVSAHEAEKFLLFINGPFAVSGAKAVSNFKSPGCHFTFNTFLNVVSDSFSYFRTNNIGYVSFEGIPFLQHLSGILLGFVSAGSYKNSNAAAFTKC